MLFSKNKTNDLEIEKKAPNHIAIIMDGNARWARSKNQSLKLGHKVGADNIENIAKACINFGVKYLTIYAFSSENWQRPADEVQYLMNLLEQYLQERTQKLQERDVKIVISGNLEKLSSSTQEKIKEIEQNTKNNKALTLNVAFSYGAREEIVNASKKIAIAVSEGEINLNQIDENIFAQKLYNPDIPDPDLLIRTAGDFRISNFLLWQLAYTEMYFTEVFWPDFDENHLKNAILEFNKRERRYGKR